MWKEESNELREQKGKTWHTLDGEREKEASVHSCEAFYFTNNQINIWEYKNLIILYGKMTANRV